MSHLEPLSGEGSIIGWNSASHSRGGGGRTAGEFYQHSNLKKKRNVFLKNGRKERSVSYSTEGVRVRTAGLGKVGCCLIALRVDGKEHEAGVVKALLQKQRWK